MSVLLTSSVTRSTTTQASCKHLLWRPLLRFTQQERIACRDDITLCSNPITVNDSILLSLKTCIATEENYNYYTLQRQPLEGRPQFFSDADIELLVCLGLSVDRSSSQTQISDCSCVWDFPSSTAAARVLPAAGSDVSQQLDTEKLRQENDNLRVAGDGARTDCLVRFKSGVCSVDHGHGPWDIYPGAGLLLPPIVG